MPCVRAGRLMAMADGLRALFMLAVVLPCAVAAVRAPPGRVRWAWCAVACGGIAAALAADPLALSLWRVDGVLTGAGCAG